MRYRHWSLGILAFSLLGSLPEWYARFGFAAALDGDFWGMAAILRFSCSRILGWKKLLFTGAVVQVTFLLVLVAQQRQDNEMGEIMVKNAFVYLGIWWVHLLEQYLYQTRFPRVKMA